jgi:hypothetical protein
MKYFFSIKKNQIKILFFCLFIQSFSVFAQKEIPYSDSKILTRWHEILFDIIEQSPGFTPPVTARSFAYINLAAYETVVPFENSLLSLENQLPQFKIRDELKLRNPQQDFHAGVAVNEAIFTMINNLYEPTLYTSMIKIYALKDSIDASFIKFIPADVIERSKFYGQSMAAEVYDYSKNDGGHQAFIKSYDMTYKIPTCEACHQINYAADLENTGPMHPYWGTNRLFVKTNNDLKIKPKIAFSKEKDSEFYQEAIRVHDLVKSIKTSTEKFKIANYWDDGANATFTPAGHSLSILTTIVKQRKLSLAEGIEIYTKLSLALNDAFITCWRVKYEFNTIRPITYIKRYIDKTFEPLLLTPPFPEFPSGHSTQAGAFAAVMTKQFGDNYPFSDQSKFGYGEKRYYRSFNESAKEVSISRIYAGIHFTDACDQGLELGKKVAENIENLKFRKK